MLSFTPFPKEDKTVALIANGNYYNNKQFIGSEFINPLREVPNISKEIIVVSSYTNADGKKATVTQIKPHIEELLEYLDINGIEKVLCMDAVYFKYLTKEGLEASVGTVKNIAISGFEHIEIVPMPNPIVAKRQPSKKPLIDLSRETAKAFLLGTYSDVEFEFEEYEELTDPDELTQLLKYPTLGIDIETTGLRFETDEILTIAFAYGTHKAVSCRVHKHYHDKETESRWLKALKEFFLAYKGTMIYHNALFDLKFIIRRCFMSHPLDMKGAYLGIESTRCEDTMIMKYLCENSTSRPPLGLKEATKFFLGDYAEDVKEAIKVPIDDLLVYNAKDTCGTFWLYDKLNLKIDEEDQREVYDTIMKPSMDYLLLMMLSGLPLDDSKVKEAYDKVDTVLKEAQAKLYDNEFIKEVEGELRFLAAKKYNDTHKTIKKEPEDFDNVLFNPNSTAQKKLLLIDLMGYPILDTTDSGAPKLSRAIIQEYRDSEEDADSQEVLDALIAISEASIVLNTFIKTFDELMYDTEDGFRLYGNQRIGGTISSRLSSNSP